MMAALNRLVVLVRGFSTYIWRQVLQFSANSGAGV
jgi:hypothetical protein